MEKDLQGKTIVLGITGGIAAYKMPNVAPVSYTHLPQKMSNICTNRGGAPFAGSKIGAIITL